MSDKLARVLGSGKTIVIGDKEYSLSPITMGALQELQRESVSYYRKQVMEAYADGMQYLGDMATEIMREQIEKLSRMDIDTIPKKVAYEVGHIPITSDLKSYLARNYGIDEESSDFQFMSMLSGMVDTGELDPSKVKELTGYSPKKMQVSYDTWWINATVDGMISLVHKSIHAKHPDVSKDDIRGWDISDIQMAARNVENITRPELGNT